jgi:lipoprotein-anchoring transpeptidase ErfK/SrfK
MRARVVACVLVLVFAGAGCSESTPSTQLAPAQRVTPKASPSPLALTQSLGDLGPPEFDRGGLNVWTRKRSLKVWARPNDEISPSSTIKTRNPVGQRLYFLVLAARRTADRTRWAKILVPKRPNGSTGWVRLDSVKLSQVENRIEVDLSTYTLRFFRKGRLLHRFEVGVGQPQNPTPTGVFFTWALLKSPDPQGPYGNYALGLSGFSPVLSDWPGGGRAAVHGTVDPGDRGRKVSHGCVRVYNEDMRRLRAVPLGTPVIIHK